ncbi:MAG TPA: aminoacyl--tRNA ligase-related protein [Patescibacteria group bacterium]|nr:aminoacyl--tRNA ligase-related protein [Patescibacteria group bacterium]
MLYSELVGKTNKTAKQFESINATLLQKGGYIRPLMSGVYSYLTLGLLVLRKIEQIVREEMSAVGGQEILMPVLHPKENWEATGRWDTMDCLFKIKGSGGADMALGPTHEEIVTPLVQAYVLSYHDLPRAVFQIQTKFRNEARSKSGLLRGREFLMKDMYSFHSDEADLDQYYAKVEKAYEKIWNRLGLGDKTLKTYASGGAFSKFSHEYQTLSENGEDIIFICKKCNVAVNKEIFGEQNACLQCGNKDLLEKKAIEVGNIFKLKTRFSESFQFTYVDRGQSKKSVYMGCYGIGISRLMGVLVELFNDGKAIYWPKEVAPFDIHLIGLNQEDDTVCGNASALYNKLRAEGKSVLFDDRVNISAGEKFADADLIGIPTRLIISKRTGPEPERKEIKFSL